MTSIAVRIAGAVVVGLACGQLAFSAPNPASWLLRFSLGIGAALYEPVLWTTSPPFRGDVRQWLAKTVGLQLVMSLLFTGGLGVGSQSAVGDMLPLLMLQLVLLVPLSVGLARQVMKGDSDLRFRLYLTLMGTAGVWLLGSFISLGFNPEAPDQHHWLNGSLLTLALAAWTAIRLRKQWRERHGSGLGIRQSFR